MGGRWGAVSGGRFALLCKALGAIALCLAVLAPLEFLGSATAGASPPTLSAFVSGDVSTGPSSTLSGTAFFDSGFSDTSPVVHVTYDVFPDQVFCPPPPTNPCSPVAVIQATPTIYGWFGEWNTTTVGNGTYLLSISAQDSASNTTYTFGPITLTVANPPPTTSMLIPSNGATVSGTALLDASASSSCPLSGVWFVLGGGPNDEYSGLVVANSTPTSFGYLGEWNTASVPNGTYSLQSLATGDGCGQTYSSPITITVDNSPPTTSVVIPSNGATESGTSALLDASAPTAMQQVSFELTGGTLTDQLIGPPAALTIFGWLTQWNTTTVPDGTYTLQSVAYYDGGYVAATSPGITITVQN